MPLILTFPVGAGVYSKNKHSRSLCILFDFLKLRIYYLNITIKKEVNIMSYQFIHIEDYGRVVSKKTKNNGSNDKYKKET